MPGLCENCVIGLWTVMIGTAFATGALQPTFNYIKYLQVEFRFLEAVAAAANILDYTEYRRQKAAIQS